MELVGIQFELPDGFRVENRASDSEGVCLDLVGDDVQSLLASIIEKAKAVGFDVSDKGADRVELERGEVRLLLVFDSSGLTIQTRDPTNVRVARHEDSAVLLADLRVELDCTSIAPLHERRMGELHRAAWRLSGTSAAEAVRRVIDEAVNTKGLKPGPIFAPAKGGREVWTGEAYSKVELIKARATVESERVLLEVDIVDKRNEG